MAGNGANRREMVALALAMGRTATQAAEESGVGLRTVQRWQSEPAFSARVEELHAQAFAQHLRRMAMLGGLAADALEKLLSDPNPAIKLGAVKVVAEAMMKARPEQQQPGGLWALVMAGVPGSVVTSPNGPALQPADVIGGGGLIDVGGDDLSDK